MFSFVSGSEIHGATSGDAKLFRPMKVLHIMRYNMAATGRKSQFQYHVIVRVSEKGSPKEMDFLQMRLARQISSAVLPGGKFSARESTACHSI